jgi:hypothetical protein
MAIGIGLVFVAGVVAAVVRPGPAQHPVARAHHVTAPAPAPSIAPAAQHVARPVTPPHHARRTGPARHAGALPFTGPAPVAPSLALALLLLGVGSWMLVRLPRLPMLEAARGLAALSRSRPRTRGPLEPGAIERLRSPGR